MNINGSIFPFPEDGEENWGGVVTSWANAVSTGLLQKSGGSFTLTNEINFGDVYSIKGKYLKLISGANADNKVINLKAPAVAIADSYDLILPTTQGAQHSVVKYGLLGQLEHGKVINANIADDAAIAHSKMAALTANRALVTDSSGVIVPSAVTDVELSALSGLESQVVKTTGDQDIEGVKNFKNGIGATPVVISALDIDWKLASVFTKTLAANSTFTFSNMADGQTIYVALTNTASNYTVTWPTVKWSNGFTPVQTTGAKTDLYCFTKIGSDVFGTFTQNY